MRTELKYITALTFLVLLVRPAFSQSLPDSITKKIDALFSRWSTPNSPGCVIGVVRNDSLIYSKGYGMANLEYAIPNTPETIYHVASVSKQFTGYAIVLLARQGKLQLDDDVRKYLPWFPDLKEKITIRQLLNHTSGVRDQWQLLAISGTRLDDVITQEHIVKLLSQQRALNFKPGEQNNYSNSGFTMLAEIVKSITGQTLRQFTDSAIFKPLGMNKTNFHDDYTEVVKNRAYSYSRAGGSSFTNSILSYSNAGATSLFTNVNDMARWIANFYYPKVGTAGDIQQLTQNGKLNNGRELRYALGIGVDEYKGWKRYSHSGGDAGYRTYVMVLPDLKMGFIVFSNLGDFNPTGKAIELADVFIKDKTEKRSTASVPLDTSKAILKEGDNAMRFVGPYISDAGAQFDFLLRDRKLYWDRYGQSDVLIKAEKDTFVVARTPEVKFLFAVQNTRDTVVKQYWPDGERVLERFTPISMQSDQVLQQYTGTYYCPELDCKYSIVLKNGSLLLTNSKYRDAPLRLVGTNDLMNNNWWMNHLRVLRNNENRIMGFEVNSGRIMHLRFNKIE